MKIYITGLITLLSVMNVSFSQTIITDENNNPIEGFGLVKDPNSNTVYFGKTDSITRTAIYKGQLKDGKITSVTKTPIIDNNSQETIPFFSADGKYIFLFSNFNNTPDQNVDLWYGRYGRKGKIKDLKRSAIVNTDSVEYYGSMSENGNIYFSSWRSNGYGKGDIFSTTFRNGSFSPIQHLDTNINNMLTNSSPAISSKDEWVIYYSENKNSQQADLVISFFNKGKWSKPVILPGLVNTINFEFAPVIGDNGKSLYFSRREKSKLSGKDVYHIYKVPLAGLELDTLRLAAAY